VIDQQNPNQNQPLILVKRRFHFGFNLLHFDSASTKCGSYMQNVHWFNPRVGKLLRSNCKYRIQCVRTSKTRSRPRPGDFL